ncbi:MAG: hypothetical protein QW699_00195 [Metallosphaera sp.]|uniref:hypothetical protein n=1 Tax=Saccharolobus sp. TaxID=2100761 RepID=UPI0024119AF2|nr:hypothetical protein [Candidatus Rehaiarchaeum fermentans]
MSLQQNPCIKLLVGFYGSLVSRWRNDAILQGLEFNDYLRRKGKLGIKGDMDIIAAGNGMKKTTFCQCFQQIYNMLNTQPVTAISDILGFIVPEFPIAEDVLKIIEVATLEYCGLTVQGNELIERLLIGLAIALGVTLISLAIAKSK